MDLSTALQLVGQFGAAGAAIAYFIYREGNDRKDRQSETESRIRLATALEGLKNFIMGRHDV
jgi:hypothetical protein